MNIHFKSNCVVFPPVFFLYNEYTKKERNIQKPLTGCLGVWSACEVAYTPFQFHYLSLLLCCGAQNLLQTNVRIFKRDISPANRYKSTTQTLGWRNGTVKSVSMSSLFRHPKTSALPNSVIRSGHTERSSAYQRSLGMVLQFNSTLFFSCAKKHVRHINQNVAITCPTCRR